MDFERRIGKYAPSEESVRTCSSATFLSLLKKDAPWDEDVSARELSLLVGEMVDTSRTSISTVRNRSIMEGMLHIPSRVEIRVLLRRPPIVPVAYNEDWSRDFEHELQMRPDNVSIRFTLLDLVPTKKTSNAFRMPEDPNAKRLTYKPARKGITFWFGVVPGYIATGLHGGANHIVSKLNVGLKKMTVRAYDEFQPHNSSSKVAIRKELEMEFRRENGVCKFSQSIKKVTP